MGTGNWRPREGVTVILEEDVSDSFWYMNVIDCMRSCLSVAWNPCKDTWMDNHSKVQFRSGSSQIVTHGDSHGHLFVCFMPRPDLDKPELAVAHNDKWAQAFFDRLQKTYPDMRVATSAWTSAKRQSREERLMQVRWEQ